MMQSPKLAAEFFHETTKPDPDPISSRNIRNIRYTDIPQGKLTTYMVDVENQAFP